MLRGLWREPHRYDRLRVLTMTLSLAILVGVPLSGLARVDLWSGRHFLLFQPAPFRHGLAGVIVAIAARYVVTFLSNVVAGRMFCGWGCPVGQLSRFGDAADVPGATAAEHAARVFAAWSFGATAVVAFFAWWVDLGVFWAGSGRAAGLAWGSLLVLATLAALHARWWRWGFCKTVCPIGLYYSFVSSATWFGVHFRNQQRSCIDCDACDQVCPVDLRPRDLAQPIPARGGLSVADAPGRNHCLECGDCVRACEWRRPSREASPATTGGRTSRSGAASSTKSTASAATAWPATGAGRRRSVCSPSRATSPRASTSSARPIPGACRSSATSSARSRAGSRGPACRPSR